MELAKLVGVEPKAPYTIRFKLADGGQGQADLTGLVHTSEHFKKFVENRAAFGQVRVTPHGSGIEWSNGLDLSVETLKSLADEQRVMSGKEFARFLGKLKMNVEEAAHLLDVSPRTVRSYIAAKSVPRTCAIALRRCTQDSIVFSALYRPIKVRPRGRPKTISRVRAS